MSILKHRSRIARVVIAVGLTTMFSAACETKGDLISPVLTTITVTPNPHSLAVNTTQQFTAVGVDASGDNFAMTPVWSVVAGGGTISSTGLFTAGPTPGNYPSTIKATNGGVSGFATVTVTIGPLATITVTPNPATMPTGGAQQFTAVGRDASNNVVAITPVWSVVNGGGAINATTGAFTAGNVAGTFANTVRATSGAISGTATVNVTAGQAATMVVTPNPVTLEAGATQQFTATARDGAGNLVAITPVWGVINGGGAINAASGLFTAGATAGTFTNTVVATAGGVSATATVIVTVTPPPPPPPGVLTSIQVTPNPASLSARTNQQFTAVGRDANGAVMAITPVWSIVNGGGTITAGSGLFTAGAETGTFANTVVATSGTISGNATVIVTEDNSLVSIRVTPNPAILEVGAVQTFTAVGLDAQGDQLAIVPTWSVVNGGGAINPVTGEFTAGPTTGNFDNTVRATFAGVSGTATVRVRDNTVVTITVTPDPAILGTNEFQRFRAVGRNSQGDPVAITPTWSVVNGGGVINANGGGFTSGVVTGTFNNTIRAAASGVTGFATVQVVAAPTPPPVIPLGNAAPNGIMAGTAVTCVVGGIVHADVSISPGNTLTGFGPCVIDGVQHLGDAVAAQAQIDLTTAYNTAMGLPCPPANAIVANLGGTTKAAGVYCSATGVGVTGVLTLDGGGDPNALFVFQVGTALTTAGDIVLINGAQAKNVFWVVGSSATIGTASKFQGNILALTSITLVDNATLFGRALARNGAVTLGTNNVITLP